MDNENTPLAERIKASADRIEFTPPALPPVLRRGRRRRVIVRTGQGVSALALAVAVALPLFALRPLQSGSGPTLPSPVGNEIALMCHWDIFGATVGTPGLVRLTGGSAKDSDPAFSPDKASIAFVRDEDIWVMASDGSNAKDLTPAPGWQANPTWSPDGSQLAYDSVGGIWIVNRDGSNPHRIPNASGAEPSWSPDGKTIVFTSPGRGWAVYTVSPTGAHLRLLRQPPNDGLRAEDSFPTWTPDGRHIAFTELALAMYRSVSNVYWIRPDGTGLHRLTNQPIKDPAWSPDSTQMAYTERGGIKIVNLSTHRSTLIRAPGCSEPSWG
jgi:TolB protein